MLPEIHNARSSTGGVGLSMGGEGERGTEHQLTASLQDHHNQNSLYQILTHHITMSSINK